jgi:hypothetical protein
VNHAAGAQEEASFEEGMREHVKDAHEERAHARGHEHVAELRDRGVREDLLDVVLGDRNRGRHERGERPDHGDDAHEQRGGEYDL